MNILGNLIWVIFGGLIMAVEYIISGAVMCLTIIGIQFGLHSPCGPSAARSYLLPKRQDASQRCST